MNIEQQRADFEAWGINEHSLTKIPNGDYFHPRTVTAWQSWQAAIASESAQQNGFKVEAWRDKYKVGLYEKFEVNRKDGTDAPGQKHHGCEYFVLDMNHDQHALPAIHAYIKAVKGVLPLLAEDLIKKYGASVSAPPVEFTDGEIVEIRNDIQSDVSFARAVLAAQRAKEGRV